MAYSTSTAPGKIANKNGSNGGNLWLYKSADALSVVGVAGYFTDGFDLGMKVGDQMIVVDSSNSSSSLQTVTVVTTDGAASISGGEQELTVSGAVTPGISEVQLNHASVLVAATIADFALHQGIFVAIDSGTGTEAHTLTLTAGTFDGTNNVATFNAQNEMLICVVDGDGNGRIIQNTGSVALS